MCHARRQHPQALELLCPGHVYLKPPSLGDVAHNRQDMLLARTGLVIAGSRFHPAFFAIRRHNAIAAAIRTCRYL